MEIAVIDHDNCKPQKCGHECIKVCPINRKGEDCVYLNEEETRAIIDEELCIGCKLCISKCPFDAINIVNTPEKLEEKPVHRYGQNTFELFRMPVPKSGMVMGIIGRNGIGKTTALEMLSGEIKPNFGKFDTPPEDKDVIDKYSNTELG
ncbi:MAG: 4Fe-4S binding protein, partial [Candidatus Aenigmatarchaeota archaeon]